MSNSSRPSTGSGGTQSQPKAIIHKQILDAAAESPEASMAELADSVSGASTSLVEQVLDRYGDPSVDEEPPSTGDGDDDAAADDDAGSHGTDGDDEPDAPSPEDLSPKQRRVLRAVADDPEATQRELADRLGVSTATISNRVNAVDGFDWSSRASLVEALFGDRTDAGDSAAAAGTTDDEAPAGNDLGVAAGDCSTANGEGDVETRDATEAPADGTGNTSKTDGGSAPDEDESNSDGGAESDDEATDGADAAEGSADAADAPADAAALAETVAALSAEVEALTARLDELEAASAAGDPDEATGGSQRGPLADPELAHKVVHTCVRSDAVTEAEELRVVEAVVAPPDGAE